MYHTAAQCIFLDFLSSVRNEMRSIVIHEFTLKICHLANVVFLFISRQCLVFHGNFFGVSQGFESFRGI